MGLMDDVILLRKLDQLASDNQRRSHGEPREDLLKRCRILEGKARRLEHRQLITISLMRRAEMLMALQRSDEAIEALTQAQRELGNLRKPDLGVLILGALAEAHAHRKDWQAVSSTCEEGIQLVETYRYKVTSQYLQSAYLRSRITLYALGVRAAYELKTFELMLQRAELSKCRTVLRYHQRPSVATTSQEQTEQKFRHVCEQIDSARQRGTVPEALLVKRRVLWDLLCIQRYQSKTKAHLPEFSLESVQATLDEDEAILYYYWLDAHSLLIITIDQGLMIPELRLISPGQRVRLEQYAHHVLEFRQESSKKFLNTVGEFSNLLLPEKARHLLKGKRRLLFSAHRLLHPIPLHALQWEGDYLIKRFAVTYLPNLSSLLFRYSPAPQHQVLGIGICDYQVPGYKLSALSKAEEEVQAIKMFYEERSIPVTLLTGAEETATEDRLGELERAGKLAEYSCLHFSTHGYNINSDTPMESYLFLKDSILDGLEIANWALEADLVVLSACCSGQRPISGRGMGELPGDELFGLGAAFFSAGAKRILSTLWPVDSHAALPITKAFHCYLAEEKPPEVALQATIIDYLKTAGVSSRRVYYWAPFFLLAMGRPITQTNQEVN